MSARGAARRACLRPATATAALLWLLLAGSRHAQGAAPTVDRTIARFFSPETGGAEYPRFVFERRLAFEARLAAMASTPDGIGEAYGERDVREALEHDIAQEILSSLADKLIADSPPDKRPTADNLTTIVRDLGSAFAERLGGRSRIDAAARAERVEPNEVDAMFRREAMAAWYVDRVISPLLHVSEEQLRVVFRSAAHPYRGHPFEQVRAPLERWFVAERLRAAESAFLQAARSRVRIMLTP